MPTKLSKYCDGIMEAAWLVALIVIPVFFNVFSSRIFEPDKLTLLRSLALVILGAWLIKLIDQGGFRQENIRLNELGWRGLLRIPMAAPVLGLILVYLIATILSVDPRISLLGSYQRLQGTYTTFSYLIVFAAILTNLRRREQVDRLITTVIVASLPVSLYGVLQRLKLDPIPWGGDTSYRIAANMGNSIFVAAYLIMVIPLNLIRILETARSILRSSGRWLANFAAFTVYIVILLLQLIALFFTGSRGPWLGFLASMFFLLVMLSLLWRKRWLTVSSVVFALALVGFLAVLNIPKGPLESLRTLPQMNRLGQVFDSESRTGRVRELIWQGAAQLVLPHAPIQYPDGRSDPLNTIRPLIGYGPESMYVAYNPFYPPELTQVEKRNASPDRSHNETWDSLVTMGLLGLIIYLALYLSVLYFGLKWLGLVMSKRQRTLFLWLTLGLGAVSAAGFILVKGIGYFGVGLPFGIILGVFAYVIWVALFGHYKSPATEGERLRSLVILGLMAVIFAHFVEINFGIAIAATRTYFWAFTGLMVVLGFVFPPLGVYDRSLAEVQALDAQEAPANGSAAARMAARKKRRTTRPAAQPTRQLSPWLKTTLTAAMLVSVLLVTLAYDFITNVQGGRTALEILSNSLLSTRGGGESLGILIMALTAWLCASILFASENQAIFENSVWVKILGTVLGISLVVGLFYALMHASALATLANATATTMQDVLNQVGGYEGLLTRYYVFIFALILGGAALLVPEWPERAYASWVAPALSIVSLILVAFLITVTNLRIVQADVAFKLADPFTRSGQWQAEIDIYNYANREAPNEDYYYLFLGRAYLEEAKTIQDATQRDQIIEQAASDLKTAQRISPLNTDHTANLARLYSLWASYAGSAQVKDQRAQISSGYFSKATTLSPHSAQLWDEWGLLYLNVLQQPQDAKPKLDRALQIDPYYDWTYGLMGDYLARTSRVISDTQQQQATLDQAANFYRKALELVVASNVSMRYSYALALGGVETQRDQPIAAIQAYQQALEASPSNKDNWKVQETIARLYAQNGDMGNALQYAQLAVQGAPSDQQDRLKTFVDQLQNKS